jgi:ribosome-binding protein aMBF1 (putative translation factor)
MTKRTCAACDGELDGDPIEVTIRGRTVEVCCEDCATKLNEANRFAERDASLPAGE